MIQMLLRFVDSENYVHIGAAVLPNLQEAGAAYREHCPELRVRVMRNTKYINCLLAAHVRPENLRAQSLPPLFGTNGACLYPEGSNRGYLLGCLQDNDHVWQAPASAPDKHVLVVAQSQSQVAPKRGPLGGGDVKQPKVSKPKRDDTYVDPTVSEAALNELAVRLASGADPLRSSLRGPHIISIGYILYIMFRAISI